MHATDVELVRLHLQETLGEVFGLFGRLVARRQAEDPRAMSRTDYLLLATLQHCRAGQRTSQLAEALGNDASTISRRLTWLESHGLVERLPDPSDGRASIVRLAAAGSDALAVERTARTGLLAEMLVDWPEEDLVELARLIDKLAIDLGRGTGTPSVPTTSGSAS
ncbi:MarR family winged helix-turn-helix transcriptional regulator [Janibacter corallicola]|uniref:MarR family winged helix-turn-helix transcriptional regulator n=1 Tax=Janibacter corallicola TaxID=415212 RepID=UPI00082F853E|nr:MarR family winged helix-turn-helix transcriptional regulator [Janibacter corallicola]